ncbi:MAG TPA: non-heme iron oxygenase ferredoxin subunit [Actinomycetota bacterium]|nr:non-heme iron oxygenase ferredoxin subunit [Actinomycetota bacterium]
MATFHAVARLDDIGDGEMKQFSVAGELVGVYRVGDDVYALSDVCSHQEAYLTEGEFEPEDLEVECPLHGSRFNVTTGEVRILPATKPVASYSVKVEGGEILVGPKKGSG